MQIKEVDDLNILIGVISIKNIEVRGLIKKSRIFQYEVAKQIGVSEYTLCKWLREELSDEKKREILSAIEELSEVEKNDT